MAATIREKVVDLIAKNLREPKGFTGYFVKVGWGGGGGVGGVTQQSFIPGGSAPKSKPLVFYTPFSEMPTS